MRIVPPPKSGQIDVLFSDPGAYARVKPLLNHPLVRQINRGYKPWRVARPMAAKAGLDPETVWQAVKWTRCSERQDLLFECHEGGLLGFAETPAIRERLHRIDQLVGGGVAAFESAQGLLSDPAVKRRFALRTMMEEAIESSRIEGAITTRSDALDLLRSGRTPKTPHEIMVTNNYAAMQQIKRWLDDDLTIEHLHALQAMLTEGTLSDPGQSGRFRTASDNVRVTDERDGTDVYTLPPAMGLEDRVQAICEFANQRHTGDDFIHPIIKACILHFMIGYEHPWCDGNGRTARAIFYWYTLKRGYRVFEYMTISEIIRRSWSKYTTAYINTEQDDGDLTYFLHYKLRVIDLAIDRLNDHLIREEEKLRDALRLASAAPDLNLRQRLLLHHAIRKPRTVFTVKSHATATRVTRMTARADLQGLVDRDLFSTYKNGRTVCYVLAPGGAAKIKALSEPLD